ncbi:MAG: cytochrome C552 [Hyphomicrobiales bacterium]|nr:MAG: cytochrome C552 [Hyphomicrobiales bacterium]
MSGRSKVAGLLAAGFFVLGAGPVLAGGSVESGAAIAQTWCINCHVVADDQSVARSEAPSFQSLGSDPDRTAEGLKAFLFDPHPPMPDMNLSRDEVDDVVAYILSFSKN